MMGNSKTVYKYFTIPQYQQEENYLSAMNEKGWKLTHVTFPGFYHFEKCEPQEASYRIDFSDEKNCDTSSYRQLFSDNGWDFLWAVNGFSIFRKRESGSSESDSKTSNEIFSDMESRISMLKKIQMRRLLPLGLIFLCLIVPNIIKAVRGNPNWDGVDIGLNIMWTVIAILYLCVFVKSFVKIKGLKSKYGLI